MQIGDLVRMRGGLPASGIVLRQCNGEGKGFLRHTHRVEVFWIDDAEATWEPVKWLEVISD